MSALFLSCEHGGNEVPSSLLPYFKGQRSVLASHRGIDLGALDLFAHLRPLADVSYSATMSRLCIELNRSEGNKDLFSAFTRNATPAEHRMLLAYYHAYRDPFTEEVNDRLAAKDDVLHISVHSFTPELNGVVRSMDIGLLYDPARKSEKRFAEEWRSAILARAPGLVVRMNGPYKGTSDGFTTALRKRFGRGYAGIELEVNQKFASKGRMHADIKTVLGASLSATMGA